MPRSATNTMPRIERPVKSISRGMRECQRLGVRVRTDPHHEFASDDSETHVALQHEAESPEHLAFRQSSGCAHEVSYSLRQSLIEGHVQRLIPGLDEIRRVTWKGLVIAAIGDIGRELVEGHDPSGCSRRVARDARMGHHHLGAPVDAFELHADLSGRRMPLRHSHG